MKPWISTKLKLYNTCILLTFRYSSEYWTVTKRGVHKTDTRKQWCPRKLLGIKWYHRVWIDDVRWKTEQPHLLATVQARHLPVQPYRVNVRRIICQADLNSFPFGELEDSTGMPPYYVEYPAQSEINGPLHEQSNWCGSELSTLEIDAYIWCYALIVVHARNEWMMNEWLVK